MFQSDVINATSTPSTSITTGDNDIFYANATEFIPANPSIARHNISHCKTLRFDDFVPWDNPDNLVSLEAEAFAERLKGAIVLPLLFLIGGPANFINMAVFYKQGLRERINLCLFALSLADELYMIFCMFFNGERINRQFTTCLLYTSDAADER